MPMYNFDALIQAARVYGEFIEHSPLKPIDITEEVNANAQIKRINSPEEVDKNESVHSISK